MPSLLAKAAMAALAGSGGRKLDGSVTACTHDICGRKLLVRNTAHGNPQITGNKYVPTSGLYLNDHNYVGLQAGTVGIESGKIKVSLDFDGNYGHDFRQCKLIVTPNIVEGSGVDPGVTSKTFNPSTNGDKEYAKVSAKESVRADGTLIAPTEIAAADAATKCINFNSHQIIDGTRKCHKLTVELDDPVLDEHSLGYLSTDLRIQIACEKNGAGDPETKDLTVAFEDADKVRVRHTFVEHASTHLSILPGDITVGEAAQWSSKAPKFLPVQISASVRAQTETGTVRFPAEDWATFGESKVNTSAKKLSCEIKQGATKDGLGDTTMSTDDKTAILANWYDASTAIKDTTVMSSFYGVGHDIANTDDDTTQCPGEPVGVACGRYHDAAVAATSANGLGFELPLDAYYKDDDKPRVECSENQGDGTAKVDPIDLTGGASYRIGADDATVSTGLQISAGDLSTIVDGSEDFGETFFDTATEKHIFTNGDDSIFEVQLDTAAAFRDLTTKYDHTFAVSYVNTGESAGSGTGASSADAGYVATLGSTLAASPGNGETSATDALTSKLSTIKSTTLVQRPTLYGQTRDTYKIDATTDGADVHFRRDEAAIDLTLVVVGTNDGTAKYTGDPATAFNDDDDVRFPGPAEGWQDELAPPTITNNGCVFCADADGATNRIDVALETNGVPAPTGAGTDASPWQFYKAAAEISAALFDTTVGVWDATAEACVEGGDGDDANKPRAYCKSAQAASDAAGYLCQKQSVTFGLEVSKDSLDDRKQGQKITVPRIYEGADPAPIEAPTIDARANTTTGHVEYIKSGGEYAASFDKQPGENGADLVASDGTHSTTGLTFGRQASDVGAKAYNCDAVPTELVYQADYNAICDGAASKIDYTVKTSVIYESDQVAPSAVDLQAGSSGVSAKKITEYALQRDGVDITFEITKSTEDGSLQYDSTSRLKVDHSQVGTVTYDADQGTKSKCDDVGKTWDDHASSEQQCFKKAGTVTLGVVAAAEDAASLEGYCLLQSPDSDGKADSMLCTLKGFQDPSYDPEHLLANNVACVTTDPAEGQVACPSFELTAQQQFYVPHLASPGDFFQGAAVSGDTCGRQAGPRLHDLDAASTVTLAIDGSDKLYSGAVTLRWTTQEIFASVDADSEITSTGATSEYASDISMVSNIAAGTHLPQDMTDLKMQIQLEKELNGANALYRIKNLAWQDYDLYYCPAISANFGNCNRGAMTSSRLASETSAKFITMSGDTASMYVQIAAKDSDGDSQTVAVDPCFNKMLDDAVYPNGVQFSVERAVDPSASPLVWGEAHKFTVPITCHTATSAPSIAFNADIGENPYPNGKSWNQKNLEVVVSGSTIDPAVPVQVPLLASTLSSSAQSTIDQETRVATLELHFLTQTGACEKGAVSATIAGGDPISKIISCPLHEFLTEGIADGALIEPTDDGVGGARYGDVFMVPMQIIGRDILLWNGPIALRTSTGADSGETVEFFDKLSCDDHDCKTVSGLEDSTGSEIARKPATLLNIPELAQADYEPDHQSYSAAKEVLFKIIPAEGQPIGCNEIELQFSSMTTKPSAELGAATPKAFTFRIKCPRQTTTDTATDTLKLNYDVTTFLYNHESLSITLSSDESASASSVAALGKCSGTDIAKEQDGSCDLNTQVDGGSYATSFSGGEKGLDLFEKCSKHATDGTTWAADANGYIISKATVARKYTKSGVADSAFTTADHFCGETPLLIKVQKSQTKYIAITVTQSAEADFDVQVSELAWAKGGVGHTCAAGEYRLEATVEMMYRLRVGDAVGAYDNGGNTLGANGAIQSYFRQPEEGASEYFSYVGMGGSAIAAGDHTEDAGHTMQMLGPCTALSAVDDDEKTVTFRIKVFKDETEYFSAASVTVRADAPREESQTLDFLASATTAIVDCQLDGEDFAGGCTDSAAIPSTYNVRLTVGVDESEEISEGQVFSHSYDAPTIKKGTADKCGLFGALQVGDLDHRGVAATENLPACGLVSGIAADGLNYIAQTLSSTAVDLVGPADSFFGVSQANRVVTLKLLPLAGREDITVGWTISRIDTASGSNPGGDHSRRLRSVQHVAYTLGADGSVSKSTSFGVLPAVRDSDGVSAVTTKEQITEQKLAANGTADGDATVIERTTVEQEKTGEDHTLAVLGIVFGGLGSVAAIAVAFFVGCASRRDASGAGSSFKTVAGGFSDRQPLFNRNRFAPSDF